MEYYDRVQLIPRVTEDDEIIGQVERWEAHQEGILHRGYTIGLWYEGALLCQHRKHPVFDGVVDLTASSHQVYKPDGELTEIFTSIYDCLEREWLIRPQDLHDAPVHKGSVVYRSEQGSYIEHEVCHYYEATLSQLPSFFPDFAYGMMLLPANQLTIPGANPIQSALAPWVTAIVEKNLLD